MSQLYLPEIIRESSEGPYRLTIQDEMLRHREIEAVGEIDDAFVHAVILQMRYLQREDAHAGITMYINSPGGEVQSGLALYDVMQALTCPVRTVCVGIAASMAALLFTAGKQRDMLPHSRVMIHDPLIAGGVGGSALRLDSVAKDLMRTRELTGQILSRHTGHSLEEVFARTATDSFFDAQEAIAWGLADRIIHEI